MLSLGDTATMIQNVFSCSAILAVMVEIASR